MNRISTMDALRAVKGVHWPTSIHIGDHLCEQMKGNPGYWPGSPAVLRALRRAEKAGWVKCVRGPLGYYGYEWALTDAGKKVLENAPGH